MIGQGTAYGAISIVNAIACGKGATFSVGLKTKAKVTLVKNEGWETFMNGEPSPSWFASETASRALSSLGMLGKWGGRLETWSDIPMGRGLKSSSSSSVAISLAVHSALGKKRFDVLRVLRCSAEASLAAGVSLTGAYDDAASCLLGGVNHTDNRNGILLKHGRLRSDLRVLIRVPAKTSRRELLRGVPISRFSTEASEAFEKSLAGEHWGPMTTNGLLFSALLHYDPNPAMKAIELGALGAGLSGTGPATAAVFSSNMVEAAEKLKKEWAADGTRVIDTWTNNRKGRIGWIEQG